MKRNLRLLALLALLQPAAAFAQGKEADAAMIQKIHDEAYNHSKLMETAFYLTDVSGPRLTASPGLKRAQQWAISQLKIWGMANTNLEPWGKFGKGWETQKNYAAITEPYYHAIIAVPKAWTPGTNGPISSEVVLIQGDTITDLNKYKGKLQGKIVIMDGSTTMEKNFNANATRYTDEQLGALANFVNPPPPWVGVRTVAPQMTPQQRAESVKRMQPSLIAAALPKLLLDENAGLLLTKGGYGQDGTVFVGGAPHADSARAVMPELITSNEDYHTILRLLKAGIKVTMEADVKNRFITDDMQGYNVVAEIPGTDPKLKEQLVMLGGHLDSWHAATGATDNGAGCAIMMEAMRILKAINVKPRRTIRMVLWDGEEQGQYGSRNYVTRHFADPNTMVLKPEHALVSAYYNLDNGSGKIRGIHLQGDSLAAPIFKNWFEPFKKDGAGTISSKIIYDTDNAGFDIVGIPGFTFIQDWLDYTTRTHHSNQDTYDKLLENDMKQAATIVATFVYNSAQRDDMMPRKQLPKPMALRRALINR